MTAQTIVTFNPLFLHVSFESCYVLAWFKSQYGGYTLVFSWYIAFHICIPNSNCYYSHYSVLKPISGE